MSKLWAFILLGIGFIFGFTIGMLCQQSITQATVIKFASHLQGVEIDMHLNETKIVEETRKQIVPYMLEEIKKDAKEEEAE